MRRSLGYPVDVYVGAFVNGIKQGYGEMYYANGAMYAGHWSSDAFYGMGTLIEENGKKKSGMWLKDRFVEQDEQGEELQEQQHEEEAFIGEEKSRCCF